MIFAHLYDTEEHGQILVKLDQSESEDHEGTEIRYYFQPEHYGVCSVAINFANTRAGDETAIRVFDNTTEQKAIDTVAAAKAKFLDPSIDTGSL